MQSKKFRKFKKRYILSVNKMAKGLHRSGEISSLRLAKTVIKARLVYRNVLSVLSQNLAFQEPFMTKED